MLVVPRCTEPDSEFKRLSQHSRFLSYRSAKRECEFKFNLGDVCQRPPKPIRRMPSTTSKWLSLLRIARAC